MVLNNVPCPLLQGCERKYMAFFSQPKTEDSGVLPNDYSLFPRQTAKVKMGINTNFSEYQATWCSTKSLLLHFYMTEVLCWNVVLRQLRRLSKNTSNSQSGLFGPHRAFSHGFSTQLSVVNLWTFCTSLFWFLWQKDRTKCENKRHVWVYVEI